MKYIETKQYHYGCYDLYVINCCSWRRAKLHAKKLCLYLKGAGKGNVVKWTNYYNHMSYSRKNRRAYILKKANK